MTVAPVRQHAPPRRSRQEPLLQQIGFDHLCQHVALFGKGCGQRDVLEEVIEPYLLQQGFLQRTPRGRMLADGGYRHLGLAPPARRDGQLDLLGGDAGDSDG